MLYSGPLKEQRIIQQMLLDLVRPQTARTIPLCFLYAHCIGTEFAPYITERERENKQKIVKEKDRLRESILTINKTKTNVCIY